MPKITVRLSSQRGRACSDPPEQVKIKGSHYVHPLDIDYFDGGFVADLVPGRYTTDVRMDGFERRLRALRAYANEPKEHRWRFEHSCDRLPTYRDLDEEQRRLIESFAGFPIRLQLLNLGSEKTPRREGRLALRLVRMTRKYRPKLRTRRPIDQ